MLAEEDIFPTKWYRYTFVLLSLIAGVYSLWMPIFSVAMWIVVAVFYLDMRGMQNGRRGTRLKG
jgi:hypothetical protein